MSMGLGLGLGLGAAGGRAARIPPLRQLSTRARIPNSLAAFAESLSCSFHIMRATYDGFIAIRVPNWYCPQTGAAPETAPGNTVTVEASIEYPSGSGTRYRLTFSGSNSVLIGNGLEADSDLLALSIPTGAEFRVFIKRTGMTNMPYWNQKTVSGSRDAMTYAASVAGDVMTGTATQTDGTSCFGPTAVFGRSRTKAAIIYDNSRAMGVGDSPDATGNLGHVARTLGPVVPYINCAIASSNLQNFLVGPNTFRRKLFTDFCTDVYGYDLINDVSNARTAPQMTADHNSFCALFPGGTPITLPTTSPRSSGAWTLADGTDQTTNANNTERNAMNTVVLARGITGQTKIADVASVTEMSPSGSGKWNADGTAAKWTTDGLHGSAYAYQQIQSAAVVPLP